MQLPQRLAAGCEVSSQRDSTRTQPHTTKKPLPTGVRLQQKRFRPETCEVNADLQDFYDQKCRSSFPQTSAYGPATTGRVPEFMPISGGDGGNGIFEAYFDIGRKLTEVGGALDDIESKLKP